jgi:hypothetical protein
MGSPLCFGLKTSPTVSVHTCNIDCGQRSPLTAERCSACLRSGAALGRTLLKTRPNSDDHSTERWLHHGKRMAILRIIQHSTAVPRGTRTGLVIRQPEAERSRISPSPATMGVFEENWLNIWTAIRPWRRRSDRSIGDDELQCLAGVSRWSLTRTLEDMCMTGRGVSSMSPYRASRCQVWLSKEHLWLEVFPGLKTSSR